MKKIYCALLINSENDIVHCVTSDYPVTDNMLPSEDSEREYIVHRYDFNNNENTFIRASDVISSLIFINNNLELKPEMEDKKYIFKNIKKTVSHK